MTHIDQYRSANDRLRDIRQRACNGLHHINSLRLHNLENTSRTYAGRRCDAHP